MSFEFGVNLAMIGDEDITYNLQLESYPSYRKIKYINYFFERFADINTVIRRADEVLENKPEFDLIMLFPVLWDIVYMDFDEFHIPSLHLKRENVLDNIVSLISSAQKRWKVAHPKVTVFWCMPFTPDFYRFNKTNFWVEQDTGRHFYRISRKLGSDLYANVSGINLLDLHECYFLKSSVCENSFYQNIDQPLQYIHSCTKDGLRPTKEFISNFVSVFEKNVYPVVLKSNRQYNVKTHSSQFDDYNHRRVLPVCVFDYSTETFRSGTSDNLSFRSDPRISKPYVNQDNVMPENSLSQSHNFHSQSSNNPSVSLNYNRNSQAYPSQSDELSFNKNYQTQSSYHFDGNNYGEDSNTSFVYSNDNSNQYKMSEYLPDVSNNSLTDKKDENTSSRGIIEELTSYFKGEDSNAPNSSTKFQPQNIPQYNSKMSQGDQLSRSVSHLSPSSSSSHKYSEVKLNVGNDILKDLSNISPNIFDNLKNALNFLGSSNVTDKDSSSFNSATHKVHGSSDNTNNNDSQYYESYMKNIFNPLQWKDVFLSGDENTALDCLKISVNSLHKISYRKGVVIIMITNSKNLVTKALEALKSLVEVNTIGLNDEIIFGAPLVLIDTASNIQLRLNQIKQQSLGDLSALLVFGDELLDLNSLFFIELTNLAKHLLSSSRGNVNKVVISQSGSADIEISAQGVFNVTFMSLKRQIEKEKQVEKFNKSIGLTDFLKSSGDLAISNDSHSSFQSSSLVPAVKKQDQVPNVRSSKTHEDKGKPSSSRHESSHSSTSSKPPIKLEDIFMRARITMPEDKKKENDAYNKEFMKKLEKMPRSVQKAYMEEGKDVLTDHESTYKTYKDVPDLHPLYEDKYEFFIKLFEEAFGQSYNPKHMQSTWKRFWNITVSCIKDIDWLDVKKELQMKFMKKYGMGNYVESKEQQSKNIKHEKIETKTGKLEETTSKIIINKSEVSDKKAYEKEGNKVKTMKEDIEENKMMVSKLKKIDKKIAETDGNMVKAMEDNIEENKMIKSVKVDKKTPGTERSKVKTMKENSEENKIINKSTESNKKGTETENNKLKTVKKEIQENENPNNKSVESDEKSDEVKKNNVKTKGESNKNNKKDIKLEKEKPVTKVEGKENNADLKSKSKNSSEGKEDKDENKLKKRSSSPGPLENNSKKAKTVQIEPSKSNSTPRTTTSENKVPSGGNENSAKISDCETEVIIISDCENESETKDPLKTVVEMRRKLIMDAEEEDLFSFGPLDKAIEKKSKKDSWNESKVNILAKKENIKTASPEKKFPPLKAKYKSTDEEKISNKSPKNTDSLKEAMEKFIAKNSESLESSKSDKKSFKEREEIRNRYSGSESLGKSLFERRRDDKHSSSSLYKQSHRENPLPLARKEDRYHLEDKHSKSESSKRKSYESDDNHTKRMSVSDKRKDSFERDSLHTNTISDIAKWSYEKDILARRESDTFSKEKNSSSKKDESMFSQDRKEDKPYKNSLAQLISSKADVISKPEPEQTSLSLLLSSLKEKKSATASKISTELSSSVKPLFPIQIPQSKSPKSIFKKDEDKIETKEDFMKLYVNTCSELSKKKSLTPEKSTSSHRTSISSIMEDLDSLVKPSSHRTLDPPKSKIVINLGKPKMQFSLYEALNSLESVCSDIGVMGAALNSIVQSSRALLPNFYESYKIFADSDSDLLVNIAINKLKSFSSRSAVDKVKYQKTIALAEKLLEEAKKSALKGPPPNNPKPSVKSRINAEPAVKSRINTEAVAKATLGFDVKDVYQFIKNTYVYKGLSEPSQSEMQQVFEEVSKIHFKLSVKS